MPNNINIRSEEVQEILGKPPAWIVRAGITVIFCVIMAVLIGSWFFKYPDIITSQVVLTTQNPPAQLRAMATGKVTDIFVQEKQGVSKNQIVAIIENTTKYEDIICLEQILDTLNNAHAFVPPRNFHLGDLQQPYATYLRLVNDLQNFKDLDFYHQKIGLIKKQIADYKKYYDELNRQCQLKQDELLLAEEQFKRSKRLYKQGVMSKSDFEKAEKQYLQEKISYSNTKSTLSRTQIQIGQLGQQVTELGLNSTQDSQNKSITITEALENLKSQINKWKQTYLIVSPIEGQVTFTQVWGENQNVQIGSIVATIIPNNNSEIIGKVQIPSTGVGKVKVGQVVNIKLDNFPHMEYGMLKGEVKNISLVPTATEQGVFYTAEIKLPKGMTSNYGKDLIFIQEMTGTADIITDDIRLLERFFNPIKAILKQNVE